MSLSPYNPKVSLLEKLANIVILCSNAADGHVASNLSVFVSDPEVLEWYDCMAELQHVPPRVQPECQWSGGTEHTLSVDTTSFLPIEDDKALSVFLELNRTGRRGYQVFAKASGQVTAEASYYEAETPEEAIHKCVQQFPFEEGYSDHGVKDIETQVETLLQKPKTLALSLED